ncbi:hypothetical protein Fmac_004924 [Flemingia macrophylla]|uniref:Uncharacterized protein n=1 Tax=Flemingia macrophylla TaxID=520843 RepID=A0ABD1N6B0_9FABA
MLFLPLPSAFRAFTPNLTPPFSSFLLLPSSSLLPRARHPTSTSTLCLPCAHCPYPHCQFLTIRTIIRNLFPPHFHLRRGTLTTPTTGRKSTKPRSSSALTNRDDTASSAASSYRSTSSIREVDLLPSDAFYDLHCIAERMVSSDYLRQCIQVYGSVRKSSVDASFHKLDMEKLSINDVQHLEWEQRLKAWNR